MFERLRKLLAEFERYVIRLRRQLDLSANQHLVLLQLNASGPMTAAELARRVGITTASMAGLMSELEQRKLILRQPDEHDQRKLVVYASKQALTGDLAATSELAHDMQQIADRLSTRSHAAIEKFLDEAGELLVAHSGRDDTA
jgi:DNA-binding MarR family transcriptional regulator